MSSTPTLLQGSGGAWHFNAMSKLFSRIVSGALGLVLVLFLVANRHPVAISLDPTSAEHPAVTSPALPLWVWLMLFLLMGFFLGATGMWMSGRDRRRRAAEDRREMQALKRENQILAARSTGEAPLIVADG